MFGDRGRATPVTRGKYERQGLVRYGDVHGIEEAGLAVRVTLARLVRRVAGPDTNELAEVARSGSG